MSMIASISNKIRVFLKYIVYLIFSSNRKGHGIHSPFVFDFIIHVMRGQMKDEIQFRRIEIWRNELIRSPDFINVEDLGAGSLINAERKRPVSSIAKHSLQSPKFAKLLYRVVSYFKPDSILELGTSFGTTTQYLAIANPSATITTIEGSPEIANLAQEGFNKNGCERVRLIQGNFNDELENAISGMAGKKFFYIDGNHRYEPTINYFNTIMRYSGEHDILVFDDIHWSKGMEQAWHYIKKDKRVKYTIDLFFMGLIFLKKDFIEKQNFIIHI